MRQCHKETQKFQTMSDSLKHITQKHSWRSSQIFTKWKLAVFCSVKVYHTNSHTWQNAFCLEVVKLKCMGALTNYNMPLSHFGGTRYLQTINLAFKTWHIQKRFLVLLPTVISLGIHAFGQYSPLLTIITMIAARGCAHSTKLICLTWQSTFTKQAASGFFSGSVRVRAVRCFNYKVYVKSEKRECFNIRGWTTAFWKMAF